MIDSLLIVLPIFALIAAGWIGRRSGALGPAATREVNRLVVHLALPALLFDIVASATLDQLWQPGFILAFVAGCGVVFGGVIAFGLLRGRGLAQSTIEGLNASYANTGYVGFPLVLVVVGESGLGLTVIGAVLTVCVLFGIAILLIEIALQTGTRRQIAGKTAVALLRNPLLLAPALGALVLWSGWDIPSPLEQFLGLLGGAAAPCALIALGLFLADDDNELPAEERGMAGLLVALKLLLQPAVAWVVAALVLKLPADVVGIVVLLSALPTGTGPFMLAQQFGRGAALTARVVLVSTLLSVVTLSVLIAIADFAGK
jgi:malonate transporter